MVEPYRRRLLGRQSLVTPIDWKPHHSVLSEQKPQTDGRQSLVTPIDWKPQGGRRDLTGFGRRQSLVTPIDWKQVACFFIDLPHILSPILGDAY